MLEFGSQQITGRRELLGYGVAVVSVGAAVILLSIMQARWQAAAHVSTLLIAIIVTAQVGGTRPGLLATTLALAGFGFLLPRISNPLAGWGSLTTRLLTLAVVALYVLWIMASERRRAATLARVHAQAQHNNDALRAENLERRRTEEELRASEAKFRALAESAPAAIFICQNDSIVYCNPAASVITGYDCGELIGKSFWSTAAPGCQDTVRLRAAARERGEPVAPRFQVKILTKAGAARWLDFTESAFEFAGKPSFVGIAFDITERKHAEEAVEDSRQLLKLVLATLPVGVAVTDRSGDIILSNAAVKRVWGQSQFLRGPERWTRSVGSWHNSGKRIEPSEWASVRALSDGQTSLNELIDIKTFTGEAKTIQNSAAPIRSAEGQIVGAVIVNDDVTERVRAEEALQESAARLQHLSRRLLAVQEEERRHLSRELHDEFGQLLATITLHLQAAKSACGRGAQPSIDESIALLQRAGAEVRSLALELRPMLLETAGLEATLRWLAAQHQQRTGIATEVVGHVSEVPSEIAIACFRVVQEALTNVVRHAQAQHVWIELAQGEQTLELAVRDDGVGFDVHGTLERAAGGGNLGLHGMRERVEILGGQLMIDSRPGAGTRIGISLPFTEPVVAAEQTA